MILLESVVEIINHINELRLIIFDLDDTLYEEKEYVKSGFHKVANHLPNIINAEEKLWSFFEQKKRAIDELLISENCYTDELKNKCVEVYRLHKPNIHLYHGVLEILIKLKSLNYKIGMITDGRPWSQKAKIDSLGIERHFDKIIITDELGGIQYRKPNLKSFIMMRDYFNINYNEICYIGDNLHKDFTAPQKLNMKSFWIKNENGIYFERNENENNSSFSK